MHHNLQAPSVEKLENGTTVFLQVITLEGWVEIMYYVMDAHSFYNFIYFILLIIVSTVFIAILSRCLIAPPLADTSGVHCGLMIRTDE